MEPSTFIIDKEIKFQKSDLEALKDNEDSESPWYRVCSLSDVNYQIKICPRAMNRQFYKKLFISLHVSPGIATRVDVDVKFTIKNSNYSGCFKESCKESDEWGKWICTTCEFLYMENDWFMDGEMTLLIKGTFKIELNRIKYPFSVSWKLKESDLRPSETSTNNYFQTHYFKVSPDSDIKYWISFYPNGDYEGSQGETWIFFALLSGSYSKVEAVWKLSIDSVNFVDENVYILKGSNNMAVRVCSTEELFDPEKGYFVNGKLMLKVTGTIMVETEREPTHLTLEKGIVQKGYHRGKNFTLIIGENSIKVHMHVLKSASRVFTAMLNTNMKEAKEKKMEIIDFEYGIVHAAIKLLYSSSLPQSFTFEQMLDLLRFSDKYEIDLIKDPVQNYLIQRISPTNVCILINFTSVYNATKLQSKTHKYLIKRLKKEKAVHDLETLDKDVMLKMLMGVVTKTV